MNEHRLAPLLSPRSIAFVGASEKPNSPGRDMMRAVRHGGFTGRVTAVNPRHREVEGYACVPRLSDLVDAPDLAVLAVRNERLEEALADAIAVGSRSAVIFASGHLAEDHDPPLAARLAAMARKAGLPICGANCMGYYNDLDGVWVCGFPSSRVPRPGSIAFIAHSGSVFGAFLHNDPRLRFALAVSPGQELGATIADYVDYAAERPEVRVIGLFMETARDPAGFEQALAKAAARHVPVVVLKVGRTEAAARAALTHSGALAGSDSAFEALFERYGVVRVETLDQLASTLLLFASTRPAAAGGLATIHDSGGERELMIDLADRVGVPWARISSETEEQLATRLEPGLLPENPLDAWGTGRDFAEQFEACFLNLVDDPDTAIGVFSADIRDGYYVSEGFATAVRAVAAATDKPVAVATNYTQVRHDALALSLVEAGVPVLDGTENALVAVRGALAWRDFLDRPQDPPSAPPANYDTARSLWRRRLSGQGVLGEAASLDLLAAWGVPTVSHLLVDSADQAVAAAQSIGLPIVAKTAQPDISHKSEVDGIRLGLRSEAAVRTAYDELAARLGPRVMIAAMAAPAAEIALGMVHDPLFGPVVMIGAGGVLVELLAERRTALAPFGPGTAQRLLDSLTMRRLLDGYRGSPPCNIDQLCEAISRFSVLAAELTDLVAEIDVNPLVCGVDIVAVDALVLAKGRPDP
jgi:acetate---CoA ligase (ADP-forming)